MIKYLILVFWVIVIVVASVMLVRFINPDDEPVQIDLTEHQKTIDPSSLIEPQLVKVTFGDSLYHQPTCTWVGSDSRQMSLSKAIETGFKPCPFCIEDDNTGD